jgi:hypothetical protein
MTWTVSWLIGRSVGGRKRDRMPESLMIKNEVKSQNDLDSQLVDWSVGWPEEKRPNARVTGDQD